jgi:CheY-like chemotaxis protein
MPWPSFRRRCARSRCRVRPGARARRVPGEPVGRTRGGRDLGAVAGELVVADGDERSRTVVAGSLRRAGYETIEVGNGLEALEAARADGVGLVMLEVDLPDMSGYEVCRDLRSESGEELPDLLRVRYPHRAGRSSRRPAARRQRLHRQAVRPVRADRARAALHLASVDRPAAPGNREARGRSVPDRAGAAGARPARGRAAAEGDRTRALDQPRRRSRRTSRTC